MLIAHELAHTIQQRGADTGAPEAALEVDANRAAAGALGGGLFRSVYQAGGLRLQRCGSKTSAPPPPPPTFPPSAAPIGGASAPPVPPGSSLASTDVQINGIFPGTSSRKDSIFFDRDSIAIDVGERPKINDPATGIVVRQAGKPLKLTGYRSEEEPASRATERITAVDKALDAFGHKSSLHTPDPQPAASEGQMDYRSWRVVDVVAGGAPPPTGSCVGVPPTIACAGSNETDFQTARGTASTLLTTAISKLAAPNASTKALLDRYFGAGVPGAGAPHAALVRANLAKVKTHLGTIGSAAGHTCGTRCNNDCQQSDALTVGLGTGAPLPTGAGGVFATICPSFFTDTPALQAAVLIHETSHGTAGLKKLGGGTRPSGTDDYGYASERIFPILPTAQAVNNADSLALFAQELATGSSSGGSATVDTITGFTPGPPGTSEEAQVKLALGRAEKWTRWAQQNTASLYGVLSDVIAAGSWTAASIPGWAKPLMDILVIIFKLTPTTAVPTSTDRFALAAIEDRWTRMGNTFDMPLSVTKNAAAATSAWTPPANLAVGTDFFALPANSQAQAKLLLRKLVDADHTISASARWQYEMMADEIQKQFHP
jgi:hypothetical protein